MVALLVYAILHQSIVIQGNSIGVLFNGLLVELPASFFTSTTSDYIRWLVGGGATKWRGKYTLCGYTVLWIH